jgi:uncharacterized damage-inducible protein DinB
MSQIEALVKEMDQEAATTRKMLSRIPDDKYDWKPHEKSMTIRQLATHIAELPSWVSLALDTDELDFATSPYNPQVINNTNELIVLFEKEYVAGKKRLQQATEADLIPNWTLRNGEEVYSVNTKGETIRHAYCQVVHHRAQMGVYLRLLDIPIPGSYGPSADEMNF